MPERSHHWSSVKASPPSRRVPSGRTGDSRWMTSAPSIASTWLHSGPAQNAVMSRTRSPGERQRRRACHVLRGRARRAAGACRCARRAAARLPAGGCRGGVKRYGWPGWMNPSRGLVTKKPRSRKCSSCGRLAPLPIGADGMRNALARSRISATECSAIHSWIVGRDRLAVVAQRLVLGPLGMADHHAEVEPLLAGSGAEADVAVAGDLDAGSRHRAHGPVRPSRDVEERDGVVGEARAQPLRAARRRRVRRGHRQPAQPRDQRADRGVHPAEPLDRPGHRRRSAACQGRRGRAR